MSHHLTILVGSVLGAAEYVADALSAVAKDAGYQVDIQLTPDFETVTADSTWLICTSTHGAGELPDNIQPFAAQLKTQDLSGVHAYVVGLGDSSYDTFCYAAQTMEKVLSDQQATLICEPLYIDVLNHPIPEEKAVEWFSQQLAKK
ncbi:FMN-binding protein MioC [Alteromonas lipotrueiana]|uniref:FMN-binding protein MioC n=1 Tax=Alteromonas lipotrueiana TaxID=2803815 RepID=UPI001C44EE90|nr:FMN-binding protein MioC [Alteromonas lipotrueiana]